MNGVELTPEKLEPENGFEVSVRNGKFHVLFFYDWPHREAGYDGEGVDAVLGEAILRSIKDAEGEE